MITDVTLRPGTGGAHGDIVAVRGWREGAPDNGLYESTNGGDSFTGPLRPQGYVSGKAQGRVTLAWASNGTWLYAMVQDPKALLNGLGTIFEGLYLSTRGTAGPFNQIASPHKLATSGSALKSGLIGPGYSPGVQAWYNQFLIVDPTDKTHVYMGLEEVFETTNAGTSWTADGPYWNYSFKCDLTYTCPGTTPPGPARRRDRERQGLGGQRRRRVVPSARYARCRALDEPQRRPQHPAVLLRRQRAAERPADDLRRPAGQRDGQGRARPVRLRGLRR